ncbi:zinc finger protein with KRAB and SCAN domains 1-like isoform X2 [Hemicordylus capensis]|nr:zinc finger protein with KRAB and SCAN domains 1-like isoform X2 [Hemicordylus capensis]XP_053146144.1 zinc finger protein with KRAB and SCAN domains 1-like isoform X2 [Hemicordylus capensis]XP_053146145.1 zinc finger protein with KRAB and SCAN domains 1-like isoform X2 [Hemicordylus capensis]XP_053146147.1 zinc finger protein with KRAB and SCAN domains 1-like isoform X2 [Hemicordylus capensis]XP_053146148.1 zinc finger protein with KRAB and SCAN domains 1-like isoform X2 [Hemicordylus capen
MKMEEQDSAGNSLGLISHRERKGLLVSQAGSIREFFQRMPISQVKQEEPDEGLLQRWEAQWEEFLKTMESPHLGWGIPQLSEDPTPWVDTKGFLASFEQVAKACQWPKEEWVTRLLPALSGEAEQAFSRLEGRDREDYGKVKAAILRGDAISREKQRQHFRHFCYEEAEGPRGAYSRLQELCHGWLKVERHSKEQIMELLILEQFLAILPLEIQSWVRKHGPETCTQAVALAEDFLKVQQEAEREGNQVAFEEAAVSCSEAGQALAEVEQRQLCTGTKQEDVDGEVSPLGQGWLSVDVGEEYKPEDSERAEPPETSMVSAAEPIPPEDLSESLHRVEFHPGAYAGERVDRSISYGAVYMDLGGIAVQQRIHTEHRRVSGCEKKNNLPDSPQQVEYGGSWRRVMGMNTFQGHEQTTASENQHRPKRQQRSRICKYRLCEENKLLSETTLRQNQIPSTVSRQGFKERPGLQKPEKAQCAASGKRLSHKYSLLRRQRVHTRNKQHKCSVCEKSFSRNSHLISHQRTHTGEKPHNCSYCGKGFSHKPNLIRHKRIHTGEKPHKCSYCGKSFTQSSHLILHERIHTGEKPYRCSACDKSFTRNSFLTRHKRTHTGEKL